jgi:hypothetical protein
LLQIRQDGFAVLIDQLEPRPTTSPLIVPPPLIEQPGTRPCDDPLPVRTIERDTRWTSGDIPPSRNEDRTLDLVDHLHRSLIEQLDWRWRRNVSWPRSFVEDNQLSFTKIDRSRWQQPNHVIGFSPAFPLGNLYIVESHKCLEPCYSSSGALVGLGFTSPKAQLPTGSWNQIFWAKNQQAQPTRRAHRWCRL